jgi:hypothetical protein
MKKFFFFIVFFALLFSHYALFAYTTSHVEPVKSGFLPSMAELVENERFLNRENPNFSRNQPPILLNFEGLDNPNNMPNPDTQGDVGPNHYVQIVKSSFGIWDIQGNVLVGPIDNSQIWTAIPGPWNDEVHTDPIVLYDGLEDRWLISSMVYDIPTVYWELIAVSQTPDPTQGWYCWAYEFDVMPDYPKFGVWDDAYYMTINDFYIDASYNSTFEGQTVMAFKKEDMISGVSNPDNVLFHFDPVRDEFYLSLSNLLPMDLDGPMPDHDVPYFLACVKDNAWGFNTDHLQIWQCDVDWDHTTSSTMILFQEIEVDSFDTITPNMNYVHQPGTGTRLFSMNDRLMFPLQYRYIDGKDILMANHTINMGNDIATVRWYELNRTDSLWSILQQNTYAPSDGSSRWMGSIAMDKNENIALGYSVSSNTIYPSIRVTGRKKADPLNEMTFDEIEIATGGGNQSTNTRWGDYSMMSVDPTDDITFWYTQMYLPETGVYAWSTRIASFILDTEITPIPEQITFETPNECDVGKDVILFNFSYDDIVIDSIPQNGFFPETDASWYIDPWTIQLPYTLEALQSLTLHIKVDPGTTDLSQHIESTLLIQAEAKKYPISILVNDSLLSIDDSPPEKIHDISLYPNPCSYHHRKTASSNITISLSMLEQCEFEIAAYNLKGEKISTIARDTEPKGNYSYTWDLKNQDGNRIRSGIYFISFVPVGKKSIIKKCIIF